jgi:thiamine pyrophosphokinase
MHATVVGGGEPLEQTAVAAVARGPAHRLLIAADSGYDHACAAGLVPDVLLGDLDSISPEGLANARSRGIEIIAHPADKDATDLTLAIELAVARGATSITVLSGGGGRLDHLLAGVLSLATAPVPIDAYVGSSHVVVVTPTRPGRLNGEPGATLSLVAVGGDAIGVSTTGLHYPLRNERLLFGSTRGVSNVFAASVASVELTAGTLLAIH